MKSAKTPRPHIAVIDLLIVIVFDLHHFVFGPEDRAEFFNLVSFTGLLPFAYGDLRRTHNGLSHQGKRCAFMDQHPDSRCLRTQKLDDIAELLVCLLKLLGKKPNACDEEAPALDFRTFQELGTAESPKRLEPSKPEPDALREHSSTEQEAVASAPVTKAKVR